MNKRKYPVLGLLLLVFGAMACVLPAMGGTQQPSSSDDQVATLVAATVQAVTPQVSDSPTEAPVSGDILPHSLYYLGNDNAGLMQVFRIERDGATVHQVTSEATNVGKFDVSAVDGSVVYIVNNQMVWIGADGSGRRVLLDGGPVDPNNPSLNSIMSPVFSPNGKTIAYGYKGLSFYALDSGVSNRVIEDQWNQISDDLQIPAEIYRPEGYSPDGDKLLITIGYYEGASAAVYYPNGNALVRLQGGEGALICCDLARWSADGLSFYSANRSVGMYNPGLWRVDASNGQVATLFTGNYDTNEFNFAYAPYLAPDGRLYYFFHSSNNGDLNRVPLQIVRSAPDGVTGRTVLRSDTFELMNEALWAPDASFVIVAFAPIQDVYAGGQAEVTYLDGRPSVVLTTYAQFMRWGP